MTLTPATTSKISSQSSMAVHGSRNDLAGATPEERAYIASEVRALLDCRNFTEALAGFLLPDAASQARGPLLEARLRELTGRS